MPGFVDNADDCNDTVATQYPGAPCSDTDGCAGTLDASCNCATTQQPILWCEDSDGDAFGGNANSVTTCSPPAGFIGNCDDCNDNDANAFPGATCNDTLGCSGTLDAACVCASSEATKVFYKDFDGDGFGDAGTASDFCIPPAGDNYVQNSNDCDDTDSTVWIGAPCDDSGASECGGAIGTDCTC